MYILQSEGLHLSVVVLGCSKDGRSLFDFRKDDNPKRSNGDGNEKSLPKFPNTSYVSVIHKEPDVPPSPVSPVPVTVLSTEQALHKYSYQTDDALASLDLINCCFASHLAW